MGIFTFQNEAKAKLLEEEGLTKQREKDLQEKPTRQSRTPNTSIHPTQSTTKTPKAKKEVRQYFSIPYRTKDEETPIKAKDRL